MEHLKRWIRVVVMILVFQNGLGWSHGCVDQESEALLQLKPFFNGLNWPESSNSSECCEWEMVECNTTTGRITKLSLAQGVMETTEWYLNVSYFLPFEQLKSLDLHSNYIVGCVENEGFEVLWLRLKKLEVLDLRWNNFNDSIISSLSGFSSLKVLYLVNNEMGTTLDTKGFESLWQLSNLEILDLSWNYFNNSLLSSLRGLSSLKELYLGINHLSGTINMEDFNGIFNLKKLDVNFNEITGFESFKGDLEFLDLTNNNFTNSVFASLSGLSHLKTLNLSNNQLKGSTHLKGLCELKNLEELDLGDNELEGPLPPCMANLSSLHTLRLIRNQFTENIASTPIPNLKSIEILSLGSNHFQISLKPFANHSSLKYFLANEGNELIDEAASQPWTPKFQLEVLSLSNCIPKNSNANLFSFLYNQFNLRYLDLSGSKFGGVFPSWLFENNARLEEIYLADNSFVGQFLWPSHPNPRISWIDISHNKLKGHIPSNISSIFPNLVSLNISKNSFQGIIPPSFGNMKSLKFLDFSNNQLSGEIKEQFANTSLHLIKLSINNFSGSIPTLFDPAPLDFLLLDGNNFVGEIPDLSPFIYLISLDISHNSLSGRLPTWVGNMSNLLEIVMSDNQFEGSVPLEFCKLYKLKFLDLSWNELSGYIPPCFGELADLENVHLRGNKLSGPIPHAFLNCTGLRIIDLGENNFTGTIPNWIGVSYQAFTWSPYIDGVPTFKDSYSDLGRFGSPIQEVLVYITKSNSLNYTGYILDHMYGIDLSCNRFSGEIPIEFGKLSNVRSLNLSHNNLTGLIPTTFSNLKQLESLDLSYNDLHGRIPQQLSEVTSLAVFVVAHNNFSGSIPTKNQFGTFNESNYEGNPFLCGPPLNKSCGGTNFTSPTTYPFIEQSEDDSFMDMIGFWVSFVVTYTIILFGMVIILYINTYWRAAWFYHIEVFINTCYYFVVDKFE
ncbi:receptor-like protein 13 isoform X2 [Tripterygium wilfordii]|uniref:receptor-like protein 13 isoform X2 n=1 Tax=Tripterygium wilfordii TaxID=458696 RepID=UPI0018F81402|nr:receptor-like protein 13 isoform X2 [Tripterygium wilfordii]